LKATTPLAELPITLPRTPAEIVSVSSDAELCAELRSAAMTSEAKAILACSRYICPNWRFQSNNSAQSGTQVVSDLEKINKKSLD
jgi:hypothetical protein